MEEARLEATRADVTRMRGRADSLKRDSATLERLAREKYGLIRNGERLYRFVDSVQSEATGRSPGCWRLRGATARRLLQSAAKAGRTRS